MIKKRRRARKSVLFWKNAKNGKIHLVILLFIVTIGLLLAGGLLSGKRPPAPGASIVTLQYTCCDKGDGDACTPETGPGQTFTYNGQVYGLIRSRIKLIEGNIHLKDSGFKAGTDPIILNSSDKDNNVNPVTTQAYNQYCRRNTTDDTYFKQIPTDADRNLLRQGVVSTSELFRLLQTYCISIPNDQLAFVCKDNCYPSACPSTYSSASCYGDETSTYDVYFRIADGQVPDFVRNCNKATAFPSGGPVLPSGGQQVVYPSEPMPSPNPKQNLQLKTFKVVEKVADVVIPWLSPFCKPAIYLYPEKKTDVAVQVAPQGKMLYTNPLYPKDGWRVTAYPNGQLEQESNQSPITNNYLYYEAEIPDTSYQEPTTGYVVEFEKLEKTIANFLTKLGLNEHEQKEFLSYWLKVLPKSKYYFVGSIPQNGLDSIAPLTINPKPATIIRVALYFKALDETINVSEPLIQTPRRSGFSVVEWGGIFKRDATHPFSCFM